MTNILRLLIALLTPLLLVTGGVRLIATDAYLAYEYNKASFPPDAYGFELADRLKYAAANIEYVRAGLPITALELQRLPDGSPAYNPRELKHMQDVQSVYQAMWGLWKGALLAVLLSGGILTRRSRSLASLRSAIQLGAGLTIALIGSIGLLAWLAWKTWFLAFHQVFFEAGSWTFRTSDTLIRLFPEKFWFDTALTITGLSLASAVLLYGLLRGTRDASLAGSTAAPMARRGVRRKTGAAR